MTTCGALFGLSAEAATVAVRCRVAVTASEKNSLPADISENRRFPQFLTGDPSQARFKLWFLSHFFFTREELLEQRLSRSQDLYPQSYNSGGQNPFLGYIKARERMFKASLKEVLSLSFLNETHRVLLQAHPQEEAQNLKLTSKVNSEQTLDQHLGQIRSVGAYFEFSQLQLASPKLAHISQTAVSPSPKSQSQLVQENPFLSVANRQVQYAYIGNWQKFSSHLSKNLKKKLKALHLIQTDVERAQTIQEYVTELFEFEIQQLIVGLRKVKMSDPDRDAQITEQVANFIYHFISIHPYANGNGRLARLLAERILHTFDLPPPIWTHSNLDVTLSKSEFHLILQDSLYLSDVLYQHYRNNSFVFFNRFESQIPNIFLPTRLYKKAGFKFSFPEEFENQQIMSAAEFEQFKKSCRECKSDSAAVKAYTDWVQRLKRISKQHALGTQSFELVPEDYIQSLKLPFTTVDSAFDYQDRYYKSESMFRGAAVNRVYKLVDVMELFTKISEVTVGMGVSANFESVQATLRNFNAQATQYSVGRQIYHSHINGKTPDYLTSGMSSWSYLRDIAARFGSFDYVTAAAGSTVVIESLIPKAGALNAAFVTEQLGFKNRWYNENEVTVIGAVSPLAIKSAVITTGRRDSMGLWSMTTEDRLYQVTRTNPSELLIQEYAPKQNFLMYTDTPQWVLLKNHSIRL